MFYRIWKMASLPLRSGQAAEALPAAGARTLPVPGLVCALLLLAACDRAASDPLVPEIVPAEARGGGKGGGGEGDGGLLGDVVPGDVGPTVSPLLGSTCPTAVKTGQWHLDFGPSGCLIVVLEWNVDSGYDPYPLTDDVKLIVLKESGKHGRITHVRLLGQDVAGESGIAHETDFIPLAHPVVPDKAGFTLHVHADGIEVWRLSDHVGGERVTVIGKVAIGDAVYTPQ